MWHDKDSDPAEETIDISDTQQLQPIDIEDVPLGHFTNAPDTPTHKTHCDLDNDPVLDNALDNTLDNDEDPEFDFVVISQWTWRACVSSRYGVVAIYILLTLVLVTSFLVLVIVIAMVCVPYLRAYGFHEAECDVIAAHIHPSPSICSCGKGCDSHYPCLVVRVVYTDGQTGKQHNATLHDNEVVLGKRCSYYPSCKSSHAENIGRVHTYRAQYGSPAQTFPCLYNPYQFSQVVRTRRFQAYHVVHGVLWSSLCLVLSAVLLVITVWKKKCQ